MRQHVIVDTGPLVALIDARDHHHRWTVTQWQDIEPPLLACEAVLSEACFLLDQTGQRSTAVFEMLRRNAVALSFRLDEQVNEVHSLRTKYGDVPMSVADACIVRMAEQLSRSHVLTLDADFRLYRKHGRQVIPLIIPTATRRFHSTHR